MVSKRTLSRKRKLCQHCIFPNKSLVEVSALPIVILALSSTGVSCLMTKATSNVRVNGIRNRTTLKYRQAIESETFLLPDPLQLLENVNNGIGLTGYNLLTGYDFPPETSNFYSIDRKVESLYTAMTNSALFSGIDSSVVINAVIAASGNDPTKIVNTSEFCAILVHTMEMGVESLVAAAFHFNEIVSLTSVKEASQYLQAYGDNTENIDVEQTMKIVSNASNLKQHEDKAESKHFIMSEDHAENFKGLLLSATNDWRALAIRCAIRLWQLQKTLEKREESNTIIQLSRNEKNVAREAMYIFAPLASLLGMNRLKNELEGVSFQALYPRQFKQITSSYNSLGMKAVLESAKVDMEKMINEDPILLSHRASGGTFKVTARVKEPFSLWRKMLRTGKKNVLDIRDCIAIRVIASAGSMYGGALNQKSNEGLCYYIKDRCLSCWPMLSKNGHFKDYVKNPKANGYQSLHYTAQTKFCGESWPFEIQIRSKEMHRVAEFGVAAHCDYKAKSHSYTLKNASHNIDESSRAYLKAADEWRRCSSLANRSPRAVFVDDCIITRKINAARISIDQRLAPYIEALKTKRKEVERERVFVFLSLNNEKGDQPISKKTHKQHKNRAIISLPSGSRVLDALRMMENQFGIDLKLKSMESSCATLAQDESGDSVQVSFTQKLTTGDFLNVQN